MAGRPLMAPGSTGIFDRLDHPEGLSDWGGPSRAFFVRTTDPGTRMTNEQLQELTELEEKIDELRGYL